MSGECARHRQNECMKDINGIRFKRGDVVVVNGGGPDLIVGNIKRGWWRK